MTTSQPQHPNVQYDYLQPQPSNVMSVFAWVTAAFSFMFFPLSGTPFALVAVLVWFTSVGLTVGSFRTSRRSAHWIVAASLLGLSTLAFVLYFLATFPAYL